MGVSEGIGLTVGKAACTLGARVLAVSRHLGSLLGVAASGTKLQVKGITAYELRDGLIVAHSEQFDVHVILKALGQLPHR